MAKLTHWALWQNGLILRSPDTALDAYIIELADMTKRHGAPFRTGTGPRDD